jgi:hypothetical protein
MTSRWPAKIIDENTEKLLPSVKKQKGDNDNIAKFFGSGEW